MAKDYVISPLQKCERKRCRKWRIDIKDGRYPSGKQKYRSQRFEGTYTQAEKKAKELVEDRSKLRTTWTVETYFKHINDTKLATGQINEYTHDRQASSMKFPFQFIGGMNLSDVTSQDIEQIYTRMATTPTHLGECYSSSTIVDAGQTLHNIFENAKREKLVSENPVDTAIRPKKVVEEKQMISFEESARVASSMDPADRYNLAVLLALEAGLRVGEVGGLKWDDIFDGCIHVRRTMHNDGKEGKTKTPSSVRTIPISQALEEALGEAPRYGDYVCGDPLGRPLRPHNVSKWLERNRDKMGLPGWGMHHFRHQFATNLAYHNVNPRTMSALLGHTSPKISLEIYTHLQGSQTADAIALLDAKKAVAMGALGSGEAAPERVAC
jgi:integrase